jgi:hypothetical protein
MNMSITSTFGAPSTLDVSVDSDTPLVSIPTLDIAALQCSFTRVRWAKSITLSIREDRMRIKCPGKVVYRIFTGTGEKDACNQHFNQYFETHEIAADMVIRLSDDEQDFAPTAKRRGGRGGGGGRKIRRNVSVDPICQVPRRRQS